MRYLRFLTTKNIHTRQGTKYTKKRNNTKSAVILTALFVRRAAYRPRNFSASNTRKAGQTMALRKPSTPSQKVVAVLMK